MKKSVIVFLSLFLFVSAPFHANANIVTTTGKYIINAVKHTPGGAKVEATNTATAAKHVIKHGVSSADLGKAIGAGIVGFGVGTGAGLAFKAITGLALDAVEWVMDKENNRVKYKDSSMVAPPDGNEYRVRGRVETWSSTKKAACIAAIPVLKSLTGQNVTFQEIYSNGECRYTFDNGGNLYQGLESKPYVADPTKPEWKYISFNELAQKDIELADGGEVLSQKDIEDYVTHLAKEGKLDTELDNSTDSPDPTKPETTCPSGTVKIGDTCIKLPDPDSPDPDSPDASACGACCSELLAILIATAKLNADFYAKSLDNDAKALAALNQINAQITKLNADFNLLLNEAKLTNKTLTEINEGQDLHFTELKQKVDDLKLAVETGNANILTKLSEVDASIKQTNEKLDKLNENLEKMQKCEGTEFNKKLCDFVDWVKQEPDASEENGTVDVTDKSEGLNIDQNRIDFTNQCPAPTPINTSVGGFPVSTELNYQPLCDFFTMLNPFVIGMGGISSALIIAASGRRL